MPIIQNVSFTVPQGEIWALLGPSGCGKTTLLRMIAGFESVDQGRILVAGHVVAESHYQMPPEKRRVGMVFQDYAIFPHLSVLDNVKFGLKRGKAGRKRAETMLDLVGLGGQGNKMPNELSGGQQQRVALARALAPEPAVLLLDEPFSNLDATLREQVRHEVRDLLKASGATAIFVTHDQEEAIFVGDQIAVMNAGQLQQVGTPVDLFHAPNNRFVATFMGHSDMVRGRVTVDGVETVLGKLVQKIDAPLDTLIELVVRPDDLCLSIEHVPNGKILSRQFTGLDYVYAVQVGDLVLHSRQPHTRLWAVGAAVVVGFRPNHPLPYFK